MGSDPRNANGGDRKGIRPNSQLSSNSLPIKQGANLRPRMGSDKMSRYEKVSAVPIADGRVEK